MRLWSSLSAEGEEEEEEAHCAGQPRVRRVHAPDRMHRLLLGLSIHWISPRFFLTDEGFFLYALFLEGLGQGGVIDICTFFCDYFFIL